MHAVHDKMLEQSRLLFKCSPATSSQRSAAPSWTVYEQCSGQWISKLGIQRLVQNLVGLNVWCGKPVTLQQRLGWYHSLGPLERFTIVSHYGPGVLTQVVRQDGRKLVLQHRKAAWATAETGWKLCIVFHPSSTGMRVRNTIQYQMPQMLDSRSSRQFLLFSLEMFKGVQGELTLYELLTILDGCFTIVDS